MNNEKLSQKQKMLSMGLYARGVRKENAMAIINLLQTEDMVDDMVWYMGQNSGAKDEELVAVAFQLVKDAKEGNKGE